jgi:hypothetical protein
MNNRINMLLTLLLLLCNFASSENNYNKLNKNSNIRIGEYLREDYLKVLTTTKSPRKSTVFSSPQSLIIEKDNYDKIIHLSIFHEGFGDIKLSKDGHYDILWGGLSNLYVEIVDSQHINIGCDKFVVQEFTYVNNMEEFISNKCIVGEYTDEKGNKFSFKENRKALFNGNIINYYVGLDYPPAFKLDILNAGGNQYGFQWKENRLELYRIIGGDIYEDGKLENKPIYILKPSKIKP